MQLERGHGVWRWGVISAARSRGRSSSPPALAWLVDVVSCDGLVRQMLWPYACGAPVVESDDRIVCASARSTSGAGLSESTEVICSLPDVPLETLPRSSGCVGAWPPQDALRLVADDGVTLGSRSGPLTPPDEPSSDEPSSNEVAASSEPAAGCTLVAAASGAGARVGGMARIGLAALVLLRLRRTRA